MLIQDSLSLSSVISSLPTHANIIWLVALMDKTSPHGPSAVWCLTEQQHIRVYYDHRSLRCLIVLFCLLLIPVTAPIFQI